MVKRLSPLVLVALQLIATRAVAQADRVRWLEINEDRLLWNRIEQTLGAVFRDTLALGWKARDIDAIALVDSSALVAIRYHFIGGPPAHQLYDVSLQTGHGRLLRRVGAGGGKRGVWIDLEFAGSVALSPDAVDVIATHKTCVACEAEYLITVLRWNPDVGWAPLLWDTDGTDLILGSDPQHGELVDWRYDCAYRAGDWDGDGTFELGIYCKELAQDRDTEALNLVAHTATVLEVEGARPHRIDLSEAEGPRKRLMEWVCAAPWKDMGLCG